jgi:hypothetical protein
MLMRVQAPWSMRLYPRVGVDTGAIVFTSNAHLCIG